MSTHNVCFLWRTRENYPRINIKYSSLTLILLFSTTPTFANSVDPDLKKPSDQDLHCLSFSLWIWTKTLYDVIRLADSQKWVWLIKLFSRIRINKSSATVYVFIEKLENYLSGYPSNWSFVKHGFSVMYLISQNEPSHFVEARAYPRLCCSHTAHCCCNSKYPGAITPS